MKRLSQRLFDIVVGAICLFVCQGIRADQIHNARYPQDPAFDNVPAEEQGEILSFKWDKSTVYPGTQRDVQVYVPKQYDASKPACLMVCMDGIAFNSKTVLDNMIKRGEIPVIIGVFIPSGKICDADGSVVRYNRSNEFDRVDNRFVTFIENEILAHVQTMSTSDGRRIRISPEAGDRMITGSSSGAICAFTAAWERPDLFSRVYSAVGTYVSMRGGHEYPELIRKTEPKPLRIFLQDGVNDAWNPLFGEWWDANQQMESALDFAGYELSFKWDRGGHSSVHATQVFPDAMRWLWKGWPGKVQKGYSRNDMLQTLLDADTPAWSNVVDKVPEGKYLKAESGDTVSFAPARFDPFTAVYPGGKHVARVEDKEGSNWIHNYVCDEKGKLQYGEEFYWIHGKPGQICFDSDGNLYVATAMGVQVCDQNGRVRAILSLPSGRVEAVAFSGHHLFVISGGKLWKRVLKTRGSVPNDPTPKSQGQG